MNVCRRVLREASDAEGFSRQEVGCLLPAVVAEFRHEVPQHRVSGVNVVLGETCLGLLGGPVRWTRNFVQVAK